MRVAGVHRVGGRLANVFGGDEIGLPYAEVVDGFAGRLQLLGLGGHSEGGRWFEGLNETRDRGHRTRSGNGLENTEPEGLPGGLSLFLTTARNGALATTPNGQSWYLPGSRHKRECSCGSLRRRHDPVGVAFAEKCQLCGFECCGKQLV